MAKNALEIEPHVSKMLQDLWRVFKEEWLDKDGQQLGGLNWKLKVSRSLQRIDEERWSSETMRIEAAKIIRPKNLNKIKEKIPGVGWVEGDFWKIVNLANEFWGNQNPNDWNTKTKDIREKLEDRLGGSGKYKDRVATIINPRPNVG